VRPGSVAAAPAATAGGISELPASDERRVPDVRVVERVREDAARVSIDDARAIVGGGRGLAGPEGFGLLEALAHELGGAVGATRAAVDSGWIDFGQQIGQTGKSVKPDLYIACGISGAIQHMVGARGSKQILAINSDPEAPIMAKANYTVVGDLHKVLPAVIAEVKKAKGL
jgi:electron transfer flavoprotein alpha subunit